MKKSKQDQTINRILFAAGILCLIVFVTTGFLLLNYVHESRQQEKLAKQLAELKHGNDREAMYVKAEPVETPVQNEGADSFIREQHTEEGMIPVEEPSKDEQEMGQDISQGSELIVQQQLTEINADYVMWLQIADTVIDYPVVQRDNDYYLKHDFYGEKSKHGTIFLDEECDAKGKFLLLHGHHMKDGTMFGSLKKYKKADFRENHRMLSLEWENGREEYEIFAGALIDLWQAERFRYEVLPKDKEEVKTYLQQLKEVAFWYEEPDWKAEDRFVVLSTCDYGTMDQRMMLIAVKKD